MSVAPSRIDRVLAATQRDLFWLPPHVRRLDRPEILAVADGSDHDLFNQVVRTACSPDDVPRLVDEIQSFHTGGSQWLVVPDTPMATLETTLAQRAYHPRFEGDAFALATSPAVSVEDAWVARQVQTLDELDDNIRCCHAGFERPPQPYDATTQLSLCTGPDARTARFVVYDVHGEPVGSGNVNVYDSLSFGFLWAGAVVPHARGRGVYRALLAARQAWARERGLAHIGLYAKRTTSGPIVARSGFQRHGPMTYWAR